MKSGLNPNISVGNAIHYFRVCTVPLTAAVSDRLLIFIEENHMHIIHLLASILITVLMISNNNVKYASALGGDEDDDPIADPNLNYLLFASQI